MTVDRRIEGPEVGGEATARTRILVAGAGVAGGEALLALRALAGEGVSLTVVAPERTFPYRPLSVSAVFGLDGTPRLEISHLTDTVGAELHTGAVTAVAPDAHFVTTAEGGRLDYDILLLAPGANPVNVLPGSVSFDGDHGVRAVRALLAEIEAGLLRRLVFALPAGTGWPLPLYELALLTSAHLRARGREEVELALVTHEGDPLELFGRTASDAVRTMLGERDIELHAGRHPVSVEDGGLRVTSGGFVPADRVVSLPRLDGPQLDGPPCDAAGFLRTDSFGRVVGVPDVYAAGDVTAFPVKQGGIAAQQADVAAEAIAARLSSIPPPAAFDPVLRGLLLTGAAPRFLEARLSGGHGDTSTDGQAPLWWPPTKVAARHLGTFLAAEAGELPPGVAGIPVEVDLGGGGSRDPDRGDAVAANASNR